MKHYLSPEKRERIVSMLTDDGMPVRRIALAVDCCATNARTTISRLAKDGLIFTTRASTAEAPRSEVWAFPTAHARDVFRADRNAASAERVRLYQSAQSAARKAQRHAEGRSRSARSLAAEQRETRKTEERANEKALRAAEAELAKLHARHEREAKAAEKQRLKAEAKTQREKLRTQTKALGMLPKPKGTATPPAPKPRGPAFLQGPADESRAKVTKLPPPPERFAPTAPVGGFSSLPPGVYTMPASKWAEAVAA